MSKMIAVVGPTASGKSELAVLLAKSFNGEVVSCDSMQIYKGMNIGTAKPTPEETDGVLHHLIDFLDPNTEYSVSDYVADAAKKVDEICGKGKIPVFCGGTGLYISSFLSGMCFDAYENNPQVHESVVEFLNEYGSEALFERLKQIDPESAEKIDMHNTKRVVRAVEVYETTGVAASEWNKRINEKAVKKDCLLIGLDFADRQELYSRIDARVDIMLEKGLLEEAKELYDAGFLEGKTAAQAIAYKELLPYIEGKAELSECVEILKRNSRRYAKRQLTWFRKNPEIKWIYRKENDMVSVFDKAKSMVLEYMSESGDEK